MPRFDHGHIWLPLAAPLALEQTCPAQFEVCICPTGHSVRVTTPAGDSVILRDGYSRRDALTLARFDALVAAAGRRLGFATTSSGACSPAE